MSTFSIPSPNRSRRLISGSRHSGSGLSIIRRVNKTKSASPTVKPSNCSFNTTSVVFPFPPLQVSVEKSNDDTKLKSTGEGAFSFGKESSTSLLSSSDSFFNFGDSRGMTLIKKNDFEEKKKKKEEGLDRQIDAYDATLFKSFLAVESTALSLKEAQSTNHIESTVCAPDHQSFHGMPDYLKFVSVASYLDLHSLVNYNTAMLSHRVNDNGGKGLRDSMLSLFTSHAHLLSISTYVHTNWNSIYWCYMKQCPPSQILVSPSFIDPEIRDEKGGTLNHVAYHLYTNKKISKEFFTFVLRNSGSVNQQKKSDGSTLLMQAAKDYNMEVCKILVSLGANVNVRNKMGKNAIMTVASNPTPTTIVESKHADTADSGVDKESSTNEVTTKLDMMSYLVSIGCDVTCRSKRGDSLLHVACIDADLDMITLLIDNGTDVRAVNRLGATALHVAAGGGKLEACKVLVEAGASITQVDKKDCSAQDKAILTGHHHIVKYFDKTLRARQTLNER